MMPRTETEVSIAPEAPYINDVRTKNGILNTWRNPFHSPVITTSENVGPTLFQNKLMCSSEKIPDKGSTAAADIESEHGSSPENSKQSIKDAKFFEESGAPSVEFPYIKDLNKELEANFGLILETMPALPCEVEDLKVPLPPLPSPTMKTLVLDLDETIIHTVDPSEFKSVIEGAGDSNLTFTKLHAGDGSKVDIAFRVRPYLKEFLETLSPYYEIIVFSFVAHC